MLVDCTGYAVIGQADRIAKGRIGERVGRRAGNRSRDVSNRAVDHVVNQVHRVGVGRLTGRGEAPALIDGDVDENRPRFIARTMSSVTSFGADAPGTRTVPITTSASSTSSPGSAGSNEAS